MCYWGKKKPNQTNKQSMIMWEECHYLVGNEKMNHFWSMKNMHVRFWVVIFAALSTFDDNEDSIIDQYH